MSHNVGGTQMDAIFLEVTLAIHITKAQQIYTSFDPAISLLEISPRSIIKDVSKNIHPSNKSGSLWEAEHWISPVDSWTGPRGCHFFSRLGGGYLVKFNDIPRCNCTT